MRFGGLAHATTAEVQGAVLISELVLFGIVFAINSAVPSYLILAYSGLQFESGITVTEG